MKRIVLALSALGISTGIFAALPAATDPTLVKVPQLPGGLVVGITGYYLQPSDTHGDLDYAAVNVGTNLNNISNATIKNVNPDYDFGYGIDLGYIFPNTGNDINLSYFHLDTDNTDTVTAPHGSFISPINNDFVESNDPNLISAKGDAEYDINQVDLTAGQYIDVGCRLIMHYSAGLRWAKIERDLHSHYAAFVSTPVPPPPPPPPELNNLRDRFSNNIDTFENSDFSGIGPVADIDASYYLGYGFGVVSHLDSSFLIGNIDTKTTTGAELQDTRGPSFDFQEDNTRRIVPTLNAKLGLDYTFVFNNVRNSDLTLEAGWQFSNYHNAIDRLATAFHPLAPVNNNGITGKTTSDVSVNGPYVTLTIHV